MALLSPNPGEEVKSIHIRQFVNMSTGAVGGGQVIKYTQLSDASNPALSVRNVNNAGDAFRVYQTISNVDYDLFRVTNGATLADASVYIRNLEVLQQSYKVYDIEAFGDTSDASADHTSIINAAITAYRSEYSSVNGAIFQFRRSTYNVSSINATFIDRAMFVGMGGIGCIINGNKQQTTSRAVFDCISSNSLVFKNIVVTGVAATGSFVQTGAAWLFASSSTGDAGIGHTADNDSNKNAMEDCGSTGTYAFFSVGLVRSSDNTFRSCAWQQGNTAQPCLYAGAYNRHSIGSAYASITTTGGPVATQNGENTFLQCEIHDVTATTETPFPVSTKATVELDNAECIRFYGGNISAHGSAFVRFYGNNQSITFDTVQMYQDYAANTIPRVFYATQRPGDATSVTCYLRGLRVINCNMVAIPATSGAIVECTANVILVVPHIEQASESVPSFLNGFTTSGVSMIRQANSTSAGTDTVYGGYIDAGNLANTIGGSIGTGTIIARPGGVTLQSGGHDYSAGPRGNGLAVPGGTSDTATALGIFFNQDTDTGWLLTGANQVDHIVGTRHATRSLQSGNVAALGMARLHPSSLATATTTGHIGSLSGEWGSLASVAAAGGNDVMGTFTISTGSGTGANPTLVLTYPGGAYASAPQVMCWLSGGSQAGAAAYPALTVSPSTGTCTMQFWFTPVASQASGYKFTYIVMG